MMRYQQKLEYTARVLNTNNGLVDDMFNASSTNNSPMFSLDENGELDTAVEFTGREKYRLRNAIQMRIDMCEIAIQFCETQREATNDLIEKIEERLKE